MEALSEADGPLSAELKRGVVKMSDKDDLRISLFDIYTEVIKLRAEISAHTTHNLDMENRVRALERWRYAMPASLVLMIITVVVFLAESLHTIWPKR
jgi:hypothetical protein